MKILFFSSDIKRNGIFKIFEKRKDIIYYKCIIESLNKNIKSKEKYINKYIKKKKPDILIFFNTYDLNFIKNIHTNFKNLLIGYYHHGLYPQHTPGVFLKEKYIIHWCYNEILSRNLQYKDNKNIFSIPSLPSIDYIYYLKKNFTNEELKEKFNLNNNNKCVLYTTRREFNEIYFEKIIDCCYINNYNLVVVFHPRGRLEYIKRIISNKENITKIWNKSDDFIKNNIIIGDNANIYEYMSLCDLLICPNKSTVTIEAIASNINSLFFSSVDDIKELSNNPKNCSINLWNSENKNKYDPYLLDKFNFNITSLNDFNNINYYMKEYMNNENIRNKENVNNILKYFFNNLDYNEFTASNKIINDINKLLKKK